jgi:hypothetical protein
LLIERKLGRFIDLDAGERAAVAGAPTRVFVDDRDQLADGVLTVAHHLGRVAPGRRDHLTADDQQPVIVPGDEALDQHAAAKRARDIVGSANLGLGVQVDADAFALVAILGLDHHRQANLLRRRPGLGG